MKKNTLLISLVVIIAVVAAVAWGINNQNKADEEIMNLEAMATTDAMGETAMMTNEGNLATPFELENLAGEKVSLQSLQGEKVYIKFWASWCSICLAGLEDLDTLSAFEQDFKVITIVSPNFNGEQSKDDFIQWFNGTDYKNLEVLLDVNGMIAKAYGVRAYPTSSYIGSDGILIKTLPGHVDNEAIVASFESIY